MASSYWTEKTVLITGSRGFVGRNMIKSLKEANVKTLIPITHQDYDLCQETDIKRMFENHHPDIIIHLAGLVGGILPNKERPAEFFYQNLMMGTLLLHYAHLNGIEKMIAAGAGCGYPKSAPLPLKEEDLWSGLPQEESAPYSLAKRLMTIQSEAYYRQHGFMSIICVPGNLYGPWDNFHLLDAHVIPSLVRKFVEASQGNKDHVEVWGSGQASRDFVYATDVTTGMLQAVEHYDSSTIVNLSSGIETTIKDVVEHLQDITHYKGEIVWNTDRPEGQLRRKFDISKAQTDFNYAPSTSIREGLQQTVDWFSSHQTHPDIRTGP